MKLNLTKKEAAALILLLNPTDNPEDKKTILRNYLNDQNCQNCPQPTPGQLTQMCWLISSTFNKLSDKLDYGEAKKMFINNPEPAAPQYPRVTYEVRSKAHGNPDTPNFWHLLGCPTDCLDQAKDNLKAWGESRQNSTLKIFKVIKEPI